MLSRIDQRFGVDRTSHLDQLCDWRHRPQHIGDRGESEHFSSLVQLGPHVIQIQLARGGDAGKPDLRTNFFGQLLPRNDIRMVLEYR